MPGEKSVLDSLMAKRSRLIAESDANRVHLGEDWLALKQEMARMVSPARKAGHYISIGTKAFGIFLALRKAWSAQLANGKRNWTAALLQTARIGISLWPVFRSRAR